MLLLDQQYSFCESMATTAFHFCVSFVRYNVVFPTTATTKAVTPSTDPIKEPTTNLKTENVNVFEVSGGTNRRRLNDEGLFSESRVLRQTISDL